MTHLVEPKPVEILQISYPGQDGGLTTINVAINHRVKFNLMTNPSPEGLDGFEFWEFLRDRGAVLSDVVTENLMFVPAVQKFDRDGKFLYGESYLAGQGRGTMTQYNIDTETFLLRQKDPAILSNTKMKSHLFRGATPV